jgi:hypothetical protein
LSLEDIKVKGLEWDYKNSNVYNPFPKKKKYLYNLNKNKYIFNIFYQKN